MKRDRSQAVVVREDKILLVKHLMDGKEFYCLPGGGIDEGETPEVSAIRELKEEAGVDGTVERLLSVQYKPDNAGNVYSYQCVISDTQVLDVQIEKNGNDWTVLQWQARTCE